MANDVLREREKVTIPQYNKLLNGYRDALQVVDDVIMKQYVTRLSEMEIVPLSQDVINDNLRDNVLFFKVTEMVYEKDEFASYKFASVFNSLASISCSIFVIIDSYGERTDFYMGVRSSDESRTPGSLKSILKNAMIGQFPGIKTQDYDLQEMQQIIIGIDEQCVASVSCVANTRADNLTNNQEFVQGLEKLVLSMKGQQYTGIIIANTASQSQLYDLRKSYESVYTQLSPLASIQINYSQNESTGTNESVTESTNESQADSKSTATGITESDSHGITKTHGTSHTEGISQEGMGSKIIKGIGAAASIVGTALAPVTGGVSFVVGGLISGGAGLLGSAVQKTKSTSDTVSESTAVSNTHTTGKSLTDTVGMTITKGSGHADTRGTSLTQGTSNAITLQAHDKSVEDILERIDKQLERLKEFESLGMFECAAYFLSESQYASEMAASTYKAIVGGVNTGVEVAAVNCWDNIDGKKEPKLIADYVKNFIHPVFRYSGNLGEIEVTPGSIVSGNELAIHMGLPRKSVCGLPVIEHSDFGKEVVNYEGRTATSGINLGKVFNMGHEYPNAVFLDRNSLAMHTFVTGSTGSGKSNTIYELIRQASSAGLKFMVIEPAKGEYKNVFGNRSDVNVFGSNPDYTDMLCINPFRFAEKIHVLEHVDRIVEIFNVCWPMYAAMPAVLKDAILQAYEACGWDLNTSQNRYGADYFPTFADLQSELIEVIGSSAYSEEVKSNYMGSLVTRVKSLTNGLNGQIFGAAEIDNDTLFDQNVIVDISRIGSAETKSLIMGILIMRMSEHRMSNARGMNEPLKHICILEEAHNILKKTSTEQNPESPSVAGKSVEMISNAIAEMRTYGEGFVIVDQSPGAVDISAIRNTNTKIIMRLPDESDRRLAGKTAGLKDEQLDEIAKLPKGVAVVYQNDWVEPVLCKIKKYKGEESLYEYDAVGRREQTGNNTKLSRQIIEVLLRTRVKNPVEYDIERIKRQIEKANIPTKSKIILSKVVSEIKLTGSSRLWEKENMAELSEIVNSLLQADLWIKTIVAKASDYDELTENLLANIRNRIPDINDEYAIAAAQCLLRNEAGKADELKAVYAAWKENLQQKGVC